MKKIMITLGACLLGVLSNNARAQVTDFADLGATMHLVDVIDISAVPTGGGSALGTNAVFDEIPEYRNGITNLDAVHLTVSSTQIYKVEAETTTADFNGGSIPIPSSKLLIRNNGGTTFSPLSTTKTSLLTGQALGDNVNHGIDLKFDPGFSGYQATDYDIVMRFTATQE